MTIATPIITDFDIEDIAPWAGSRLIDLHMAALPSKIIKPFVFMLTNKQVLGYQKLRPRYEPMDEITQTACEPLCPEGWYFDCATETCKEYSYYKLTATDLTFTTTSITNGNSASLTQSGLYPTNPNIAQISHLGNIQLLYSIDLFGTADAKYFNVEGAIDNSKNYLGNAKDAGNDYIAADPWGNYWYSYFTSYSELVSIKIKISGTVEGVK